MLLLWSQYLYLPKIQIYVLYVDILKPTMMVLGGEALGTWCGHEDGDSWIGLVLKIDLKVSLFPSTIRGHRNWLSMTWKRSLPECHHTCTLILDFWPLELWEINFCGLQAPRLLGFFVRATWTDYDSLYAVLPNFVCVCVSFWLHQVLVVACGI